MRTILIAAVSALALVAMPAMAQVDPSPSPTPTPSPSEEPEPTPPCEVSEEFPVLGLDGAEEAVSPSVVPAVGHDIQEEPYREESVSRYRYRVDVSGSEEVPTATRANVRFDLGWDNDGDYDLYVYDVDGNLLASSTNFNPLDGAGEIAFLSQTEHCTDLTVEIVNYLAPGGPLTNMTLASIVSSLRE